MADFLLSILTPEKTVFKGKAQSVLLRTSEGDVCILKGHEDYVAALDVGMLKIVTQNGTEIIGAAAHGFVNVAGGNANIFAITFENINEIDVIRAQENMKSAQLIISNTAVTKNVLEEAKAKYKRSKTRIELANLVKT